MLRCEGQALVEFALVAPLVLLLILGIVDFGRAYNYKNDVTNLANQAARYAEVNSCTPCAGQPIEDYIKSLADSNELRSGGGAVGIVPPGVKVSFCLPEAGSTGDVGESLQANVTATYRWLPYLNLANVDLVSHVIVRIDTAYDPSTLSNDAYANVSGTTFPLEHCGA